MADNTYSYEQLADLPSINGVTLKGNRDVAEDVITNEEIDEIMDTGRKEKLYGAEL